MAEAGFIGIGRMGAALAGRLLEAGHTVRFWNRSQNEETSKLIDRGAVPVEDPAELLQGGTLFSMLGDDNAFDAVFTDKVLEQAVGGTIHVVLSTVSAGLVKRQAALHLDHGVSYISAPVLGRPNVAAEGKLGILVSGNTEAVAGVRPFLDLFGDRIWVVSEQAEGANLVKISVNFLIIHALQALAESVTMVESAGIDPKVFIDVIHRSLFPGAVYNGYGTLIAERRYDPPGFTVGLGLKDLTLAEEAAAGLGVQLPSAAVLRQQFEATLAVPELRDLDWSAIAELTRSLRTPPVSE